jgi:glutamate formiminotransferase
MKWVECVPNFSEGRDPERVEAIAEAMGQVEGAHLLHVDSERDTHRCVMTLMGVPEAVEEALFRGVKMATERIDLRSHKGSHPRMGATDVVPFVPWSGVDMVECVASATRLGARLGAELDLPVWLYGAAASVPENRYLHDLRRGHGEKLARKAVDFGPARPHPSAGAVAVGARPILVAMNCTLDTEDVRLAKALAAQIREFQHVRRSTDGEVTQRRAEGLPGLRAMGWLSARDRRAQVSMNLTNTDLAPPHLVFDTLSRLCALTDTALLGTELVGMIPEGLLAQAGVHLDPAASDPVAAGIQKLRLGVMHDFLPDERIIERALSSRGLCV